MSVGLMKSAYPSLQLVLDTRCNNNCYICGAAWPYRPCLNTEMAIDRLLRGISLGIKEVVFSGGEVTSRNDLADLVVEAKRLGYERIIMLTNGRLLSNPNLATTLIERGVAGFGMTLYGHTSEVHEEVTRVHGSFIQTVQGIKTIQRCSHSVPLSVNCVVVPGNFRHLAATVRFLTSLNVKLIQLTYVVPIGRAKGIFLDQDMPSMAETLPFIRDAVNTFRSHYEHSLRTSICIAFYPFCVLRGLEEFSSAVFQSRAYFASAEGQLVPIDVEISRQKLKIKRSECEACTFNEICDGVWQEYVDARGWSEFVPITDLSLEEIIPGMMTQEGKGKL